MRSIASHPTPQHVLDAIHVVAAWLREIEAVEALISPEGGASFHDERMAAKYLEAWSDAEAELEAVRAELAVLAAAAQGVLAANEADPGEGQEAAEAWMDRSEAAHDRLREALDAIRRA